MKRVNLLEYFELAESLANAKRATSLDSSKGGNLYISLWGLPPKLREFLNEDNGFSTSKYAAAELASVVDSWISGHVLENGNFSSELFDKEFSGWEYGSIPKKIDSFRSVFEAECHDVDVYSVSQISIYKTQALVANGSHVISGEYRQHMSADALKEFDDAGRCLAFDLPTACGFHALRGTELVMDVYLKSFGITKNMKSWNDYIMSFQKLRDNKEAKRKPSEKVSAMLDRMRTLDRNPLMHPREVLDGVGANHVFSLSAITVVEMIKDSRSNAIHDRIVKEMINAEIDAQETDSTVEPNQILK
ncbi:hypothetical protein [Rhizobium skierniewicense]|uniref:hypothetical protein n=1 Tax=Rhizobium skierniewicense TaxID=984260 RepID=UPI0015719FAD|nr:hypothetical protein [Rhizobium skierniewicense]NTF31247.1 hypothetical protein [Rhizobium skierniewicense]